MEFWLWMALSFFLGCVLTGIFSYLLRLGSEPLTAQERKKEKEYWKEENKGYWESVVYEDEVLTRAISIRQPFVEEILCGIKKKEYRNQKTNIRERVYIYAGLNKDNIEEDEYFMYELKDKDFGHIVGSIEIVDCKTEFSFFVYLFGIFTLGAFKFSGGRSYAYTLKNPRRLKKYKKPINQPQPRFWKPQFASVK